MGPHLRPKNLELPAIREYEGGIGPKPMFAPCLHFKRNIGGVDLVCSKCEEFEESRKLTKTVGYR